MNQRGKDGGRREARGKAKWEGRGGEEKEREKRGEILEETEKERVQHLLMNT